MPPPLLEVRSLTKRFPGVLALHEVSFDLHAGEVHALCGENGAGKSTLIKLLGGIHPHGSYDGEILVDGKAARFASVREAGDAGIAVITQEFALVDELTIAENLFLGREPRRLGMIDWPEMDRHAGELLAEFGLALDAGTLVANLGVGQKQLVEILRALDKQSRVLVLDEPTAALPEHEVEVLLEHVRKLRERGTACIYISHKLDEVFAIADRITVLRDGESISTRPAVESTVSSVIRDMVGREITELFPRTAPHAPGPAQMRVSNLSVARERGGEPFLRDISFTLHAGEVLGIGGLMGAGRTELLMHLFGAWGSRLGGTVELEGQPYPAPNPGESIRRGLVLASEDRRRFGLVLDETIGFNLSLSNLAEFTRRGVVQRAPEEVRNQHFFSKLRIKATGQTVAAGSLSGGSQQKVVLGKALMTRPRVVLLDEPTRGIDVGAKIEVYELINQLTAEGEAVLLVSSELPELMGMSDRIIMLSEGRIGGEFARADFSQEKLLAAAMTPIFKVKHRALIQSLTLPAALIAVALFFAFKEPAFLGSRNLTQLLIEFAMIGTLALGMFLIILTGNIDLSVGSGVGLIGGIAAVLVFHHAWGAPAALSVGLLAAIALWAVMGALIVKQHIPSFIITLGGLLVFKGLFWLVISNSTVPVARGYEDNLYSLLTTQYLPHTGGLALAAICSGIVWILAWRARSARRAHGLPAGSTIQAWLAPLLVTVLTFTLVVVCNQFRGLPLAVVILGAATALIYFLTRHTPFGRYLYAIGGNEEAARLSGIRVERIVIGAFALMGVMVAITGFMTTAYSGASTTTVGELMELDAIAACVIGGTALKGGRGSVWGVLLGALIMTMLLNGMTLMAVSPELKFIARGSVLALAVWMDVRFARR